jgi:GNAT superfamily N-acetyltransferase
VVDCLHSWIPEGCYAAVLHAGDVGWQLRLDDDVVESSLTVIRDGVDIVAVAIADGPSLLRPAIRPDRVHDLAIAELLADNVEAAPRTEEAWCEAPSGSALRSVLSARGWRLDPDPWAVLYKPLAAVDGEYADPLTGPLRNDNDIADRVEVQRSAFTGSTFTVPRWHQMASGPGYDPSLDLLRRDITGVPVAAATGWSAGTGRSGILEPVGVHADFGGRGHGKAVSMAVIGALARAGASGVTVHTPVSNSAAVRTYEGCGLRQVETTQAMYRPAD